MTSRSSPHFVLRLTLIGALWISRGVAVPVPDTLPIQVFVDGQAVPCSGSELRIPASHKKISFRLGESPDGSRLNLRRIRYRLDGIDSDWNEPPGIMNFVVRFFDNAGDQVARNVFPITGRSAGWHGSVENSEFTDRQAVVKVPPRGTRSSVWFTSAGPPETLGICAVEDIRVSRSPVGGPAKETSIMIWDTKGDDLEQGPRGWIRDGIHPSMAKLMNIKSSGAWARALCLVDDDPFAHAAWRLRNPDAPKVTPGEEVTFKWRAMHDIGLGTVVDASYGHLEPGHYRLQANVLDALGVPTAVQSSVNVVVLLPYWQNGWFWIAGVAAFGTPVYFGTRWIVARRVQQQLERVRMVERERLRIARDLHDDLGARLTHISLVSSLAEQDLLSPAAASTFKQISTMTRELIAALYQTVWTVNPANDHLDALVSFLCQLSQNLCEPAGLRCRITSTDVPSDRRVTSEIRHDVILAVKEALHNAIKHAGATEIEVRIEFEAPRLRIVIIDNGHGFDPEAAPAGCGLPNMQGRMEAVGGSAVIVSSPNAGTQVRFDLRIP